MPLNVQHLVQELFDNVWRYKQTKNFKEILDFMCDFPHMGVFNALLIYQQRPGAKYALTARQWLNKYNCKIRPDASPLVVLMPFGPVGFVYEISDVDATESKKQEIIERIAYTFKSRQDSEYAGHEQLEKIKHCLPIYSVRFSDQLQSSATYGAFIEPEPNPQDLTYSVFIPKRMNNQQYTEQVNLKYKSRFFLSVKKNVNKTEQFALLAHELGHLFCEHLPAYKDWWTQRKLDKQTEEFEAEVVSYLVCKRQGVNTTSEDYLASYMAANDTIPPINMDIILRAVDEIEKMINYVATPTTMLKRGFLYRKDKERKKTIDSIIRQINAKL